MNTKNVLISLGVLVVLVLGVTFPRGNTVVQQVTEKLGGQTASFHMFLDNGYTAGGRVSTTTGAGITAYTTQTADFAATPSVILWNPNANQTITLSSTSTLPLVPKIGDVANVYFLNSSTTAAAAITFAAADSNADLQFAEATGGDLVLLGLDWVKMTIIHQTQYKVTFILDEMTEAD